MGWDSSCQVARTCLPIFLGLWLKSQTVWLGWDSSCSVPVQPKVTISPSKDDPLSPCTLLLCTVASFYLQEIEVRWLKNRQRVMEGVFYGEECQKRDRMYQTQVMLEDTPQRGDVYACQEEHTSLGVPLTVSMWIELNEKHLGEEDTRRPGEPAGDIWEQIVAERRMEGQAKAVPAHDCQQQEVRR
uniref:Ig-like domain-containing protein n=1 Tax=Varanus komodoensis TaxID=61221 RepID=A0A8D2Q4A0_VARKO